ncbi:MAG: (d)CMP kinase, partial [Candidatus Omnitrophica bacterium]|nr:(d)CMP kinase [Candidatus Omnitrophota bacterium]
YKVFIFFKKILPADKDNPSAKLESAVKVTEGAETLFEGRPAGVEMVDTLIYGHPALWPVYKEVANNPIKGKKVLEGIAEALQSENYYEVIAEIKEELATDGVSDRVDEEYFSIPERESGTLGIQDKAMLSRSHLSDEELAVLRGSDEEAGFIYKREYEESRVRGQITNIQEALRITNYDGRKRPEDQNIKEALIALDVDKVIAWIESPEGKFSGQEVHILDGVGPDAKAIGRLDRKVAEYYGFPHETANIVMIAPDGNVIVQLRNTDRFDDHLGMYGGHLKVGSTHYEGALAETLEETGLAYLDFNPSFVGYEHYAIDGDNNKERRSWFVKILTQREYANIEIEVNRLKTLKDRYTRLEVKEILSEARERVKDGKNEVVGKYLIPFAKLLNAKKKTYVLGKINGAMPYENKPVRYLYVRDAYQGRVKRIMAYFTPDSLDRLFSDENKGDLLPKLEQAVNQARRVIAGIAKDLIDRDEKDGITVEAVQRALHKKNTIVLNSGIGRDQQSLAEEVVQKANEARGRSKKGIVITLIGGGGTGKSTTAQAIAKKLNVTNVYVGLIYRALALEILKEGFTADADTVAKALEETPPGSSKTRAAIILEKLELISDNNFNPSITYNGQDINSEIEERRVDLEKAMSGTAWSQNLHKQIAHFWLKTVEAEVAQGKDVVVDLRPKQAELIKDKKLTVYLTADILIRAGRRANDNIESKGLNNTEQSYASSVVVPEQAISVEDVLAPYYNNKARVYFDAEQAKVDKMWEGAIGSPLGASVGVLSQEFYDWVRISSGEGDRTTGELFANFIKDRIPAEWIESLKTDRDAFIELFPGHIELTEEEIVKDYPKASLHQRKTEMAIEQMYETKKGLHARYIVANMPGRSSVVQLVGFLKFMGVPHDKILIHPEPTKEAKIAWYEKLLGKVIDEVDSIVFIPVSNADISPALNPSPDKQSTIYPSESQLKMRVSNQTGFGGIIKGKDGKKILVLNIRSIFGEATSDFVDWLTPKAKSSGRLRKIVFYGTAGAFNSPEPGSIKKRVGDIIVPDQTSMEFFDSVFGGLLSYEISFDNAALLARPLTLHKIDIGDKALNDFNQAEKEIIVQAVNGVSLIKPENGKPVLNATTANVGNETARMVRQLRGSGAEAADMELYYLVKGIGEINASRSSGEKIQFSTMLRVADIPGTKQGTDANIKSRDDRVVKKIREIISDQVFTSIREFFDQAMVPDGIPVLPSGSDRAMLADKRDLKEYQEVVAKYSNKKNSKGELVPKDVSGARIKFDEKTLKSLPFRGNTVVVWFDEETNQKFVEIKKRIQEKLSQLTRQDHKRYGEMMNKVAFVDDRSFHLTLFDLINPDDFSSLSAEQREIKIKAVNEQIRQVFASLRAEGRLAPIQVGVDALGSFMPFTYSLLIALSTPRKQEDLDRINYIREEISKATGIVLAKPFVAHSTLGYIVNPMNVEEYAAYKKIVDEVMDDPQFKFEIELGNLELRLFETMDDYGENSVDKVDLAMYSVLDINDPKSSEIALVGGKAASLKELGSIPGIRVPAGFNVTTKVYADYLEQIGAAPYIAKLEDFSEQWKVLPENEPGREALTIEMRRLSEEIQAIILSGEIPEEVLGLILESYRSLDKEGLPALVAVRSSATAEDMPGASFAGQYKTYLNQQGDAKVIEAIKKVWASTYNMNAIEYRNKQNMQHSKNKMCALILEMVNPQSAGTAFSVDTETGAPFISLNNTYGLGEAEVSGIVTSDTWVIDPQTNTILKRRLGKKNVKIVYDPEKRENVILENSERESNRFAISTITAKEIARQVRIIHEHYTKKSVDIKYIDAEYVVTSTGDVVFTQTRPETVWGKGRAKLLAVDKEKARSYPVILEGGVTGSSGVATGVIRIVRSVEDAAKFIEPGDIMVAPNTTNVWEHSMGLAGGIITEVGGNGNHTAVVSREQGKPAIVGNSNAIEILKEYDNQEVTIDATLKRVYLGAVPSEYFYSPDKIQPLYGGLYSETLEDGWEAASKTGQTHLDSEGGRWIGKPNVPVGEFMGIIFQRNHRWIAERLKSPIRDRFENNIYQVNFEDIYQWMERIQGMSFEELEAIHIEKIQTIKEYLEKSNDLELTEASIREWIDVFIRMNAYMGFAYNFYKITEGMLEDALKEKAIPEPYFSQVRQGMSVIFGATEATERLKDYRKLLALLSKDGGQLLKTLQEALAAGNFLELEKLYPQFYELLFYHATNYKASKSIDATFFSEPPLAVVVKELIRDIEDKRIIRINEPTAENFYPDDYEFQRIARLALISEKVRQDSHHIKARGQWKFAEVLKPLAVFLIEKGEIEAFGDIFDHSPEWIMEKVADYEKARPAGDKDNPVFHIKPYEIQDLIATNDDMIGNETIDEAMLTSMGRWKFDSVQWMEASRQLVLVNAARIEEVVKPEFLEKGQHSSRDIVLTPRELNDKEHTKIDGLAGGLGIDSAKVIVIKLDQVAAFHRIYGLYSDGVLFIREDILSEGNQDQIKEALDHLRLKPTGLSYEELKKIQYHGDLRSLITKLSNRTIKWKLLFSLYGEKEAELLMSGVTEQSIKDAIIRAISEQLGAAKLEYQEQVARLRSDALFYDGVTREMVRNKAGFIQAVDIFNKMNDRAVLGKGKIDKASLSDVGGVDFNNIRVNRMGNNIDIKFKPAQMQDILNNGIDGFVPVIIDIIPLMNILPILGLEPADKEEFNVSSLN